jgi:TolA-binding protein
LAALTQGAPADTAGVPAERVPAATDTAATEKEQPEDRVAVARFRAAELYMFRFDDPERALKYYRAVVEKHPESGLAPKAALAAAWIYDTKLANKSRARRAYEAVLEDYPATDYAEAARESLSSMELRRARE